LPSELSATLRQRMLRLELTPDVARRTAKAVEDYPHSKTLTRLPSPSRFSLVKRARSQAPAWERDCETITPGRPREILRKLPMNLPVGERRSAPTARPQCSLGQRPRSLSHNGLGLKARNRSRSTHCARPTAWDASFAKVLGRCPRLQCGWAVGPEMRQAISEAMPGSCPTINAALWPHASLRMTAKWVPFLLLRKSIRFTSSKQRASTPSAMLVSPADRIRLLLRRVKNICVIRRLAAAS